MRRRRLILPVLVAVLISAPALAEQPAAMPDGDRVAELFAAAKRNYAIRDPRQECRRRSEAEIVVCVDRGEDLRVPSTADSDPDSLAARRALNNGVPRAPQLDRGSCKGQPGCITGGYAPPPIYEIDVRALPQAPDGSDADKVARGELAPR